MARVPLGRRLDRAAAAVRRRHRGPIGIGIVLGSGLGGFARELSERTVLPYERIPGFPRPSGVVGHAGELVVGRLGRATVAVLSGRVHYYEGFPMDDVVFPARLLARLGATAVILTNAAGGIRRSLRPGALMLISDHINLFGTNPLIGAHEASLGPRFPDMSAVYDAGLRRLARSAARRLGISLAEGVYVGNPGPSYETPAEIRAYARLGADAVGMSTVPEAIALAHSGVRVLGISTITNMAAGIVRRRLIHEEVLEQARASRKRFAALLRAIVAGIEAAR